MIIIKDKTNCNGCSACYNVCPKSCITMESDKEGFQYPIVERSQCIDCKQCEVVCPIIHPVSTNETPEVLAGYSNEINIRLKSSSGGVFYYIAKTVINDGGVVFGASFDKEFHIRHTYADTINGIEQFMGSKYAQSKIGNCYFKAMQFLENGKKVLFSGTPCQIAGLRSFLRKDYDNLVTVDIVCHGVPSPMVWREYVKLRGKKVANITSINFRDKRTGWGNYSITFDFISGKRYKKMARCDYYMRGFLSNLYLRPSCYKCDFKGEKRFSDITLADFWGVEKVQPDIKNDDMGISMIFLNTEKAKKYLRTDDSNDIKYYTIKEPLLAIQENPSTIKSAKRNKMSNEFFNEFNQNGIKCALKKYCTYKSIGELYLNMKIKIYHDLKTIRFLYKKSNRKIKK